MYNRLMRDRIKWGSVVAMGLLFSLYTTKDNLGEKRAVPDKAEEGKNLTSSTVRREAPCPSIFWISYGF